MDTKRIMPGDWVQIHTGWLSVTSTDEHVVYIDTPSGLHTLSKALITEHKPGDPLFIFPGDRVVWHTRPAEGEPVYEVLAIHGDECWLRGGGIVALSEVRHAAGGAS